MNTHLIDELKECQEFHRLEQLADLIGELGDETAIEALLDRLAGERVQADPDVETAVCDALVRLGIMRTDGKNLLYKFLDTPSLPPNVVKLIAANPWLPRKYF